MFKSFRHSLASDCPCIELVSEVHILLTCAAVF